MYPHRVEGNPLIANWKIRLAATSAKLANYVGGRGGKLTWRQYAPNWKITMALDSYCCLLRIHGLKPKRSLSELFLPGR
jgi:hypothetical protein